MFETEVIQWRRISVEKIVNDTAAIYVNKDIIEFVKGLDLKGKDVIDGGCNVGLYSIFFAKKVGRKGLVHAFDVQQAMCDLAAKNAATNGIANVVIYHMALSEKSNDAVGFTKIDYNDNPSSVGVKTEPDLRGQSHCGHVETASIDDMELKNVGLIKLDLEGWEPQALKGAWKTITEQMPPLIIELSPGYLKGDEKEVIDRLRGIGYSVKEGSDFNYFFTA